MLYSRNHTPLFRGKWREVKWRKYCCDVMETENEQFAQCEMHSADTLTD